jgi:hypothetical protein
MNSDMMFLWYQGGRKVSSAGSQRGGKITKSMFAVPSTPEGAVRTVKMRRVRVIEEDRAYGAEGPQVVFAGRVVAVPGDHVQRRVADLRRVELPAPLDDELGGPLHVLIGRHRRLEVPRIGQAVGADGTAARQVELGAVVLAHEAARRPVQRLDAEDHAARHDGDFQRADLHPPQLGEDLEPAGLRHDEELAVRAVEVLVLHGRGDEVVVHRQTDLRVHVPGRGHGAHACEEGQGLALRDLHRVPAVLAQRLDVIVDAGRGLEMRQLQPREPARMLDRGADAVAPGPLVLPARGGEGRARELLGVEPVIDALGRVACPAAGRRAAPPSRNRCRSRACSRAQEPRAWRRTGPRRPAASTACSSQPPRTRRRG